MTTLIENMEEGKTKPKVVPSQKKCKSKWQSLCRLVRQLLKEGKRTGDGDEELHVVSESMESGTVVAVDADGARWIQVGESDGKRLFVPEKVAATKKWLSAAIFARFVAQLKRERPSQAGEDKTHTVGLSNATEGLEEGKKHSNLPTSTTLSKNHSVSLHQLLARKTPNKSKRISATGAPKVFKPRTPRGGSMESLVNKITEGNNKNVESVMDGIGGLADAVKSLADRKTAAAPPTKLKLVGYPRGTVRPLNPSTTIPQLLHGDRITVHPSKRVKLQGKGVDYLWDQPLLHQAQPEDVVGDTLNISFSVEVMEAMEL